MTKEKNIINWINAYKQNGYLHGSILVAINGEIIMHDGFGMANWEHEVPNTALTKFRIGSITKGFTAMAIYQLHERALLHIDDTISKFLPHYPNGEKITLYHCMTGTSGVPDFTGMPDFWFKTMRLPATLQEIINSFKDLPLNFDPGSDYEYSTSNYMLLTAVIEKVTSQAYSDYMRENIFLPLGMNDTGVDNGREIIHGLASGYSFWEKPIHAEFADLSFPLGGYGLYSTTGDLYKWSQALRKPILISEATLTQMLAPNLEDYACGLVNASYLNKKYVGHFGDISGFTNDFLAFQDDEITIIHLSNMNITPVMKLTRELAKIAFGEFGVLPDPALPISLKEPISIDGTYYFNNNPEATIDISYKDNEFYLTVPKMYGAIYKFKLIPISERPGTLCFLTNMIHEKLYIHFTNKKIDHVEYIDYYGNKNMLIKKA
ncbi:serine hydrolase [Bacillus sp. S/N-304-OC-R1]|uniref:serine hydrolase domain-containing protein n=1 Tax=Bacillus sp. S/N-304-OC-R1 TaxID=2758034 RepID=UPI001C8DAB69|nr:serine hydrolase domain-containing protein [Bacillus sp. S/N-304-OC-R1]MBY0123043.1 beta-lactamase family protein [Bacillus sp. S/N-304-OC-R1]